jgi:EpsI family protein
MRESKFSLSFLKSKYVRVLTGVLILQAVGLYAVSRQEQIPPNRPLEQFPREAAGWRVVQEGVVEQEILDVLKADELLNRTYADANGRTANLFVAYFRSQRTGKAPHSPKNCLPGSGWTPSESTIAPLAVPGVARPLSVNRHIVSRGDQKSLVLYWYQARDRAIASEYKAKIYMVADAIRYNRTDTALVRVVTPVLGNDVAGATAGAEDFVRAFFPILRTFLPS